MIEIEPIAGPYGGTRGREMTNRRLGIAMEARERPGYWRWPTRSLHGADGCEFIGAQVAQKHNYRKPDSGIPS